MGKVDSGEGAVINQDFYLLYDKFEILRWHTIAEVMKASSVKSEVRAEDQSVKIITYRKDCVLQIHPKASLEFLIIH